VLGEVQGFSRRVRIGGMKPSRTSSAATIAVIVLLPVLYVLSSGPALALMQRGVISEEAIHVAYYPLIKVYGRSVTVERWLHSYWVWWVELLEP
jgi:hypothetical protein